MKVIAIEALEHDHRAQKAGRGSKTKSNVMIMAESTVLEDIDTGKVDRLVIASIRANGQ